MKFEVVCSELQRLGQNVLRGYKRNDSSLVAFKVEDNKFKLVCYSPTTYFQGEIPAMNVEDSDNEWKSLDGQNFKQILSVFYSNNENIKFTSDKIVQNFVLRHQKNRVTLKTVLGDLIQEENNFEEIVEVDALSFVDVLGKMSGLRENHNTNSFLSNLELVFKNNNIIFIGTDSYVLGETTMSVEEIKIDNTFYHIRGEEVSVLTKPVEPNEIWTLIKTDTKIGFKDQHGLIGLVGIADNARHIPAELQKDKVVKETEPDFNRIGVNSASFKKALNNISKISSPNDPSVTLSFGKNGLTVMNISGDVFDVETDYKDDKRISVSFVRESLQKIIPLLTDEFNFILKDDPVSQASQVELLKVIKGKEDEEDTLEIDNSTFLIVMSNNNLDVQNIEEILEN